MARCWPRRVGLVRRSRHQALAPLSMCTPGGIDSLCSPCGQPTHCVRHLSNGLSPVVEPRSGILIPPRTEVHAKKKARIFMRALLQIMAVRGGLTRFARPSGSPLAALVVCPTGFTRCRTPVGDSHPPLFGGYKRKKPVLSYRLSS